MQVTPKNFLCENDFQDCQGRRKFANQTIESLALSSFEDGLNHYDPETTVTLKVKDLERLLVASASHLAPVEPTPLLPANVVDTLTALMNVFSPQAGTPTGTPSIGTPVSDDDWNSTLRGSTLDSSDAYSLTGSEDAFMGSPGDAQELFDPTMLFGMPPCLDQGLPPSVFSPFAFEPFGQSFQETQVASNESSACCSRESTPIKSGKVTKFKMKKIAPESVELAVAATIASGVNVDAEKVAPPEILAQQFPQGIRMPANRGRSAAQPSNSGHACEVCGRVFSRRFNLKTHMKTHEVDRERPFKCDAPGCSADFCRIQDLQRHQAIHGEPDFFCDACGKGFVRRDALLRHQSKGCSSM